MFKNFLLKTQPAPKPSSNPSPSSTSLSLSKSYSQERAKMSLEKATGDYQVASPTQIDPNEARKQDSLKAPGKDDDVPELILPPDPPSTIEMTLNEMKNESSSSNTNHPTHVRTNSIETTLSQSMDLSSFIKSLGLQEQQQNQKLGNDVKKNVVCGSHTSICGSLSLAASQVDISLANDTEDIEVDGMVDKIDDSILSKSFNDSNDANDNVENNANSYFKSCDNNNRIISDKPGSNEMDNTEMSVLEESTGLLVVDESPKNSPRTKTNNGDRYAMAHVGNHLFRESLEACTEEMEKENLRTSAAAINISDTTPSKKNNKNSTMVKLMIFTFIVISGVVLVINGNENAEQHDFSQDLAMSNGYHLIRKNYLGPSESNPWVRNTIDRFQNLEYERIPLGGKMNDVDLTKRFSQHSSPRVNEERKNFSDKEQPQEKISRVQNSDREQISVGLKNKNDQNDLILYRSSTFLNEERTNIDGTEHPQEKNSCVQNLIYEKFSVEENNISSKYIHKSRRYDNDEKPDSKSYRNWYLGSIWSLALLFLVSRLVSYSLSDSHPFPLMLQKEKIEAKIEAKLDVKPPVTPTNVSLNRVGDSFLTPPMSFKIGSHEPTHWMSPVYGEGAVDVSTYKQMKAVDLRELLRDRKCDTRGNKDQMIKMLIQSYQNELACLTVQQLRPKLRKRNLSQKGTKKDIIRRLVEAGPL